jgi:phosphoglycerate kinase
MNKAGIEEVKVQGKRVFVRVDFNVPMDEQQNITMIPGSEQPCYHQAPAGNGAKVILASISRPAERKSKSEVFIGLLQPD